MKPLLDAVSTAAPSAAAKILNVIPLPRKVKHLGGTCVVSPTSTIELDAPGARPAAAQLQAAVNRLAESDVASPTIQYQLASDLRNAESYRLSILPTAIRIGASAAAGFQYATQTLLQLLDESAGRLETMTIADSPRFAWRGLMLDSCRHLMPIDGILRLLDCMAIHKLNVFHWHLTDDQGWRVESKKYPRLTAIGAYRRGADGLLTPAHSKQELPHDGTYGGFYTHDDLRRVVAHATSLHIRVVPEIEMPGHAMSVLAAYPELSCTGGSFETGTRCGVFKDVFCAGNDQTFDLLQGVLEEILPLFPDAYVHVGGDECPKDRWKTCPKCQARMREHGLKDEHALQSYFVQRIARFLATHGKKVVCWDEILEGGLPDDATVMSWRGTEGGIAGAKSGRDVVMTPHPYVYLDYAQADHGEPVSIPDGLTPLEKTYSFEPIPAELTAAEARHILGLQGNVWTEFIADIKHAEYMIWPRAAAIAEIGWSDIGPRDMDDFRRRATHNEGRLAALGSNFRPLR